ncbi:membrane protein [Streptomyces hygroscopicus]|uniref:peptidoglycan-binding protein n=1 Tax=Streptomyces hygroscopicus TaxID=1912 RepID=UPI0022407E67|nr:peptidoglycan-binding protein [Streptomyces hygroscopicus]MCW7947334.1 membrane protein [Streptomyces hygroscopicus]
METPVFEEFDPQRGCDCPGCVQHGISSPSLFGAGTRPVARKAFALAAATGALLGVGHTAPAVAAAHAPLRPGVPVEDEPPATPQGRTAPLHGTGVGPLTAPALAPTTTRAQIINRAKKWVAAQVPYSMDEYWSDGYRQDCSGFVSMAWNLGTNEWTGSLDKFGVRIAKGELQPGDMLLFHNPANPEKGSHVVVFGGWTDYTHTYYVAYEQTPPATRRQSTPYAYWSNSARYVPYRYKHIAGSKAGTQGKGAPVPVNVSVPLRFPGAASFGEGADNKHVTQLGELLVARGGARFYTKGPGPRWSEADRRATRAFQQAQGWTGRAADGLPGPTTWQYLVRGKGRDIPASKSPAGTTGTRGASSSGVPGYPGLRMFRPGANNPYVTLLGRQLIRKGFGAYYSGGPGPRWGEADRRNVEAFQRAQGWRGGAADGYPGPETWRRLFS